MVTQEALNLFSMDTIWTTPREIQKPVVWLLHIGWLEKYSEYWKWGGRLETYFVLNPFQEHFWIKRLQFCRRNTSIKPASWLHLSFKPGNNSSHGAVASHRECLRHDICPVHTALWTIEAFQVLCPRDLSRQEYVSVLPCPPLGCLSWPRDWELGGFYTCCIAGRFFIHQTTGEHCNSSSC